MAQEQDVDGGHGATRASLFPSRPTPTAVLPEDTWSRTPADTPAGISCCPHCSAGFPSSQHGHSPKLLGGRDQLPGATGGGHSSNSLSPPVATGAAQGSASLLSMGSRSPGFSVKCPFVECSLAESAGGSPWGVAGLWLAPATQLYTAGHMYSMLKGHRCFTFTT